MLLRTLFFVTSLLMAMTFLFVICASGEGTLGIGFSQSVDGEISVGIQGEHETENLDIEFDYQGLDFHDAKINLSYRHDFGFIDASIFQENDFTGYSLDNMNRNNDLGISAIYPIRNVDLEIAIFGRSGNTAAPVVKYDEDTGEVISETPGLTPVDGIHPNVSLSTEFNLNQLEVELKGLTNITEEPTPQWLLDASTNGEIQGIQWVLSGAYMGQRHQGETQHEFSSMLTFGIDW